MHHYLEFTDEKSNKFWEITLDGKSFTVRYGKIGTDGQTQTKDFSSTESAEKEAEKLLNEKLKKGYVENNPSEKEIEVDAGKLREIIVPEQKALVDANARPDKIGKLKQIVSMIKSHSDGLKIIKHLEELSNPRSLDAVEVEGKTIITHLLYGKVRNAAAVLDKMFSMGLDRDVMCIGSDMLSVAVKYQDAEVVAYLLDHGFSMYCDILHDAVSGGLEALPLIRLLLDRGADMHYTDRGGETPLDHLRSEYRYFRETYYLLEKELMKLGFVSAPGRSWNPADVQEKGFKTVTLSEVRGDVAVSSDAPETIKAPNQKIGCYRAKSEFLWKEITHDAVTTLLYKPVLYRFQDDPLEERGNRFYVGTVISCSLEDSDVWLLDQDANGYTRTDYTHLSFIGEAEYGSMNKTKQK